MIKTTPDGNIFISVLIDGKEHEAFVEYEDAEAIAAIIRRDDIEEMTCSVAERYPDVYEKLVSDEELLEELLANIKDEMQRHEANIKEDVIAACIFKQIRSSN